MKYQAVIFDLFGTLVDSYEYVGYMSVLRETSSILKLKHEDFMRLWAETAERRATGAFTTLDETLEYICKELGVTPSRPDIKLARMIRYDYIMLALTPRPGTLAVLAAVRKAGCKTGLISNCSQEPPVLWPHTALAPFFDAALFSSTTGIQKPDKRMYLMCAEKLGMSPGDCLYIDDNANNLRGAVAAGMDAALLVNENELPDTHAVEVKGEWDGAALKALPEVLDMLE